MAIREGRWDCRYCGTTGIPGREKVCPNCARSRPEGTKFYLAKEQDEAEIKEASLIKEAKSGADWICEYCGSSNPQGENVCHHCGAARESTSPEQAIKTYGAGEAPSRGDMAPEPTPQPVTQDKKKQPAWLPIVGVLALLVLVACACGAFLIFRNTEKNVTVAEMSWERTVGVEAFRTVTEEDWEVPAGGRTLSERQEIRSYEQVLTGYVPAQRQVSEQVQVGQRTYVCGQRDLGNGFFEDVECTEPVYETRYRTEYYDEPVYEQVPVYDTLYTYEIDKWVTDRTERAAGNDQQPSWPAIALAANEREGTRTEQYVIVFVDEDGERYTMEFTEEEWLTFEPRGTYELRVSGLGEPVEIVR